MKGAQISIEFLIILVIVFFIFLSLLGFFFDIKMDLRKLEVVSNVRADCFNVAEIIHQVLLSGEGSSAQIRIDRNITIQNNTILMKYDKTELICKYLGKIYNDTKVNGSILFKNVNNSVLVQNE